MIPFHKQIRPTDAARVQQRAASMSYVLAKRQTVAATCAVCQRETRGWTLTADNVTLCRGCALG